MSQFTDARDALLASIEGNRAFLAAQDDPATLSATFAGIAAVLTAVSEWTRAIVSLHAMMAANEQAFELAVKAEQVVDIRQDARRLIELAAELRSLVIAFAAKARR